MARPKAKKQETLGLPNDPAKSQHNLDEIKATQKPRRIKRPHPYGPATSALRPLAQRFVEVMQTHTNIGQAKALRLAGHRGSDQAVTKGAYRLMKDPTVLEALREGAVAQLSGMVPRAILAIDSIIKDPSNRNHYKAIDGVLSRAGLPEIKQNQTTVVHKVDRKELVASIAMMVERLGIALDPSKLLPRSMVLKEEDIIEAEYTEREE